MPVGRVVFLFNKLLLLMLLLLDDDGCTFVLFFNEDDGCDVGAVLCFLIADETGGCFVDEEFCIFFLADEPC